ncbi:MAG: hypothetical protein WC223_08115 [Bacteroidales bacterium]|jgi:hypothetical protein
MKKLIEISTVVIFILSITFSSCKKYDDGPMISLASKKSRVVNKWVYESVMQNGVNTTSFYTAVYDYIELKKDGSISCVKGAVSINGTWAFDSKKENIITTIASDVKTNKILKLKSDEMWLEEENLLGAITYHYKSK